MSYLIRKCPLSGQVWKDARRREVLAVLKNKKRLENGEKLVFGGVGMIDSSGTITFEKDNNLLKVVKDGFIIPSGTAWMWGKMESKTSFTFENISRFGCLRQ